MSDYDLRNPPTWAELKIRVGNLAHDVNRVSMEPDPDLVSDAAYDASCLADRLKELEMKMRREVPRE